MKHGKVLVVDDEPGVCRLVQRLLESEGYAVTVATDGIQGLAVAEDEEFDAAIVDYQMPGLDGLQVLGTLCQKQPHCVRFLMSGYLDVQVVVDAVNRGEVARVVPKPFKASDLLGALEEAFAGRGRLEAARAQGQEKERRELLARLEDCLQGDAIKLALQPIVCATDSSIGAYEGLLRSSDPVLSGPAEVLQAAESLQRLGELADVVADRANGWLGKLPATTELFMNMHPEELADPVALKTRLTLLAPYVDRVVLEITERRRVLGIDTWEESIEVIRDLGFRLALDDIGAGYSSLSMLAQLQPQFVKIDMSIVRGVDGDIKKRRLVELLVRFAEATDTTVIAEGVETEGEAAALRDCGAHRLQGYLFGRPGFDI